MLSAQYSAQLTGLIHAMLCVEYFGLRAVAVTRRAGLTLFLHPAVRPIRHMSQNIRRAFCDGGAGSVPAQFQVRSESGIMSLRNQTACLLIGLSVAFMISTWAVQVMVVMPAFVRLERQDAEQDVERCVDAIERELENLSGTANDWASWDDTCRYVEDHNEAFVTANLVDEAFSNTHLNLICVVDKQRRIVWGECRDMTTLEKVDVPDLFAMLQEDTSPLTTHADVDDVRQGILLTSNGALLVASRPIISTNRQGPVRGSVVMGRFLSREESKSLAERTHVSLDLWTVTQNEIPAEARLSLSRLTGHDGTLVDVIDAKTLHASTILEDVYGKPAMLLRVSIPRDVTLQGNVSASLATGCSIAGGIFTMLAIGIVLQCRIVGPLQRMATHAIQVGKHDDLRARLKFARTDEIGTLAGAFDSMVQSLAETRKKVLDSAHRAGMAEIASEVLHNVGNAVNSANCSVELLGERLVGSRLTGLERAVLMLREQAPRATQFFSTDPRGPKLIEYLVGVSEVLRQEQADNQADVVRLRDTVSHIRDAIAAQQTFAGRSDFRQEVELPALIDDALHINNDLIRTSETQVKVRLAPLPELELNRSMLTQVMVNLIRNAVQSMQVMPSDSRHLTIEARCVDESAIEIEVTDTGAGFGDEVRSRLFTHGFTTKPEGNGFGLHYCANAVREAGGHVTAQSAGPGQGAAFRVRLPGVVPASKSAHR